MRKLAFMPFYTDSHCHLNFPELQADWPNIRKAMHDAGVTRAMCISTQLETFDAVQRIATEAQNDAENQIELWATVGVHPDEEGVKEPTKDELIALAQLPRVIAIGETGLDYYQMEERKGGRTVADMEWQRNRFRTHIQAAQAVKKPLVIHTREARDDTLAILKEQGEDASSSSVGGVFHCFTDTAEMARAGLDLGFYISFSGIITFKKSQDLRDIAKFVPLDRMLIETDSPYLAPVPHRGKTNNPSYVIHVARQIAEIRGLPVEEIAATTSRNFELLFSGCMA